MTPKEVYQDMVFIMIIPFITLFAMWVFEYGTLTKRGSLGRHISVRLFSFLFLIAGFLILYHFGIKNIFWYYALNIVFLAACAYLFSESLAQKVFWFFTGWCFSSFLSSICYRFSYSISPGTTGRMIRCILYFASYVIIFPLYFRYWRDGIKKMLFLFEHEKPVYALFPAMAFLLFIFLFGPFIAPSSFRNFSIMVFFIAFIVFIYYLVIAHFNTVFERSNAESRLKNAERQLLLQKKYYAEVDRGVRAQRELLHDIRHHLITINYLAKSGDDPGLLGYVQELVAHYGRTETVRYCENSVVNAIIGGYIEIAEEKGIAVSVEIDIPQKIGIDDYDLCILFGNTIENTIEACQRIPKDSELYARRSITIKTRAENDRLAVRIENTFVDDALEQKNIFPSSKGSRGGVGLESVRSVVEQNQGCMSCGRQGSLFIFSAVLCAPFESGNPDLSKVTAET